MEVFDNGYLDISGHQSGVTIGSIEGSGNVFLGANRLTVGTNNINTSFSGVISGSGSAVQGRQRSTHFASQRLHRGQRRSRSRKRLNYQTRLYRASGRNRLFKGQRRSATAGHIWESNERRPTYPPEFRGSGTVSVGPVSTLGNISTRAFVQTGDNVMIGGFIVQGTEPKRVIIRAIGPELTQHGVPNVFANPTLELHDGTGALIASNDNWVTTIIGGIITDDQVRDILDSGHAPGDARESAIIADLPPGNYTAIVRGVNNTTGVALVEVYDLSPDTNSILGNISTRSFVQTGDDVMIGGFIVQGTQPKKVILRAIGPELHSIRCSQCTG